MLLDLLSLAVGAGMIALLYRIGHQLGTLSAHLGAVADRVADHEGRLRGLERFRTAARPSPSPAPPAPPDDSL
jgi:hypothetical protein